MASAVDGIVSDDSLLSAISPAFAAAGNEAAAMQGAEADGEGHDHDHDHDHNVNDYPGELSEAMDKIWAGEGGEGGAGLGKMWPSVRIPALTEDQLKSIIPGNTLRNDGRAAFYYDKTGKIEGWVSSYEELKPDKVNKLCTASAIAARDYWREDDRCWKVINNPMKGVWKIDNHKLCTNVTVQGNKEAQCWHVALILDRIGLFNEEGAMHKVGKVIKKGRVLGKLGDDN